MFLLLLAIAFSIFSATFVARKVYQTADRNNARTFAVLSSVLVFLIWTTAVFILLASLVLNHVGLARH